jgi:50S ribosomal protein L16 3-hydroxylase
MLARWLAPLDVASFLRIHLHKLPLAGAGTAMDAIPLLDWETFDHVLQSPHPLDLVTVAGGQLVDAPAPRSLGDLRGLMARGVSVVVRASEQHDGALGHLAASFRELLSGEVHIQLYATPAGTNSYGWHYDFEDVFIAQTLGEKDYYFRENFLARETRLGEPLDFSMCSRETSPLFSSKLLAGDWLYIPARWWHLVKCVTDSLSISVGVMPIEALQQARRIPAGWQASKHGNDGKDGKDGNDGNDGNDGLMSSGSRTRAPTRRQNDP